MTSRIAVMIATLAGVAGIELLAAPARMFEPEAAAAAGAIPAHCVEHTPLGNGPDFAGDYRCAGLAIDYHVAGVARSPEPIWAGQWLFTDQAGNLRLGMCTFNRGIHPRADVPATPVDQSFPNDPSGAKRAYLTWRHGTTTDPLTAAALWAVFHYYARDAAGTNRADDPQVALVGSLELIGERSGRQDIEDRAIALDAEAAAFSAPFTIEVFVDGAEAGRVSVRSGDRPVAGVEVQLGITGATFADGSTSTTATTNSVGDLRLAFSGASARVTVAASVTTPGAAQVYRGPSADPRPGVQSQTLITAGTPGVINAADAFDLPPETTTTITSTIVATTVPDNVEPTTTTTIPPTTTTTTTTTTTVPETTTTSTTTTTVPETTTTVAETTTTTTVPETTRTETTTTTTVPEVTTTIPSPPAESVVSVPSVPSIPPDTVLPRTGSDDTAAYLGTSLLVAGIGVIGAVRRNRASVVPTGPADTFGFW